MKSPTPLVLRTAPDGQILKKNLAWSSIVHQFAFDWAPTPLELRSGCPDQTPLPHVLDIFRGHDSTVRVSKRPLRYLTPLIVFIVVHHRRLYSTVFRKEMLKRNSDLSITISSQTSQSWIPTLLKCSRGTWFSEITYAFGAAHQTARS